MKGGGLRLTLAIKVLMGSTSTLPSLLLIKKQQKKQKQHNELVAGLQVGDEVLTAGGILGKITGVSEHYAVIAISDNTEIKIQKASVSMVVPKGTYDEA